VPKVVPATPEVTVKMLRSARVSDDRIATVGEVVVVGAPLARVLISSGAASVVEGRAFTVISEE